ncbi:Marine sediment metagenome DNA, contig: S12H4_S13189 (Fragment) OS=marine sediment metagenome GN=S12H4_44720 PE=4 SV=1 [Gemmataceae bacterium]
MTAADTEFHATLGRIRRFQLQLVHLRRVERNPANHRLSSTGYLSEVDRM